MSGVGYRTATPADLPSLRSTWAEAFPATDVSAVWAIDPGRFGRTFVAVRAARVVAAVHYLPRRLRAADGTVDLVGGVANVATRPAERGQGHMRRLLDLAVTAMTVDGCAWALLFTGTPEVYHGSGFRTFRLGFTSGRPAAPTAPPGAGRCGRAPGRTGRTSRRCTGRSTHAARSAPSGTTTTGGTGCRPGTPRPPSCWSPTGTASRPGTWCGNAPPGWSGWSRWPAGRTRCGRCSAPSRRPRTPTGPSGVWPGCPPTRWSGRRCRGC
ncbi:GNAT family N-acetyltransferase [Micromonospora echinospora]|uniref:GNAT family N-acetyltransferase n=1 Tax=Micromonospora echinospora TaxID=1877 RepID=UPI003A879110